MDRDALVRTARRRQALDALAFERDRATLLSEQLEETVASLDGAEVDAALYAQLASHDVQLVRSALRDNGDEIGLGEDESEDEAAMLDADGDEDSEAQEAEEEILRLQGELELSGHRQAALQRYLDLL